MLVYLNISVAFDMLDYGHLLEGSRELFRLDEVVLKWLQYCLTNHKQFIAFDEC